MRRTLFLLSALVWSVATASDARAFATLSSGLGADAAWDEVGVPVFLDIRVAPTVSFEQVELAVMASLDTWNAVTCSYLVLDYAGVVAGPPKFGIYIHWAEMDQVGELVGIDAAAVTETYLSDQGGVYRADMHLNPSFPWGVDAGATLLDGVDVEGVVTHELGHAIGLAHTRHRLATMYYAGGDSTLRTLEDDDRRALCYLYPTEPFTAGQSCDSCAAHDNCDGGEGRCLAFPDGAAWCGDACSADADCPAGFSCRATPDFPTPLCLPNSVFCSEWGATIPVGGYCYGNATCASGQCLPTPTSAQCTQACTPGDDSSCPEDTSCILLPGDCGGPCALCVATGDAIVGDPCGDSIDCESGLCLAGLDEEGRCSAFCDATKSPCPAPAACAGGLCVQAGDRPIGAPCLSPFECEGMYCMALQDTPRCSAECGAANPCPGNALCRRFEVNDQCLADSDCGGQKCVPLAEGGIGLCGCSSDADCEGREVCGAISGGLDKVCQLEFCVLLTAKGKLGDFCDDGHPCSAGLGCDDGETAYGLCHVPCQPPGACADGACDWRAGSGAPAGFCTDPAVGAPTGEACSATEPCAAGLACAQVSGGPPRCYSDCDMKTGLGCEGPLECVDLAAPDFPGRGVCVPGSSGASGASLVAPDAGGEVTVDAGHGGGGDINGALYRTIERAPSDDGGCGAARGATGTVPVAPTAPIAITTLLWVLSRRARRDSSERETIAAR